MKDLKNSKQKLLTRFAILIGIVVLLNIIGTKLHKQFDLTAEKRFSLSEPTKKLLRNLKDDVVVEVYLEGKFPAGFQQLHENTSEVLQQFKEASNNRVRFKFINPIEGKDEKEKNNIYTELASKGITPVNLQIQLDEESGYSEKMIFPAAVVSINGKNEAINLLENSLSENPNERLHYASLLLEYKFANAIKNILKPTKEKIAIVAGNHELLSIYTINILYELDKIYDVDTIDLNADIQIAPMYKTAIFISPTEPFTDQNKFKIDQYIMQGGNALWCLDILNFSMDSLISNDAGMAIDYNLNLEDMFFKYGCRINPDYIEDYQQALSIPVTVGMIGNQPDIKYLPWQFYPFSIPNSQHPIVKNLDAVMFKLASSIDTIANPEVKKTILLTSSNRSRRVPAPVRVSLSNLKFKPTPDMFKENGIPMAVLLEGKFNSLFANRIDPNFIKIYTDSLHLTYRTQAEKEGKIIVVSDGNICMNDFSESKGPTECGYYKYTQQMFANKAFILNCVEYLTEDFNLLEARNKSEKLRLLDLARIKKEKLKWQIINIAVPIALVLIFANAYFFFRKRKYEGAK